MRVTLILIAILFQSISLNAQDLQKYIDDFTDIVVKIPLVISEREQCDKTINILDDLSDDIGKVLNNNDDLNPEDIKNLKSTKTSAEALEAFLRTTGNSSYVAGYLKEKELSIVRQLLDFSIAEVYREMFCVNVYEVKFGSYVCLVAFKKGGNDILKIKAQIKSNNGKSTSKIDMGLVANQYRRIWSNADQLSIKSYVVTGVECLVTGKNNFGF
jgi:hypothetical protein